MSLVLALLAQVGSLVTPGAAPPLPHQTADERPQRRVRPAPPPPAMPVPQLSALQTCLQAANPADAIDTATAWRDTAKGAERAQAGECLGIALSRLTRWGEARTAFLAARDDAGTNKLVRARLGAMAGNAALAEGDAGAALAALEPAQADAAGDAALTGDIAADRARALVALKRDGEAARALSEARAAAPGNALAWLLSATHSRRTGKLAEAQAQIEKAAELLPVDPEIGLEAGVIAVLSGHDEAARKSWQSVIGAAPQSEAATTARGYLAQLGPQKTGPEKTGTP